VIALRFGIGDGNSNSLPEIGKKLGVTRERVRQLEGEALMKLRALLDAEINIFAGSVSGDRE